MRWLKLEAPVIQARPDQDIEKTIFLLKAGEILPMAELGWKPVCG